MAHLRRVCFDIDGVLCDQVEGDYAQATPHPEMIALVNRLYAAGYQVILHTSRFMGRTGGDVAETYRIGLEFTQKQLAGWGVRYHELYMGKPRYDVVVDDRSIFYDPDCEEIERLIHARAPLVVSAGE
jgi:hypothetical protein